MNFKKLARKHDIHNEDYVKAKETHLMNDFNPKLVRAFAETRLNKLIKVLDDIKKEDFTPLPYIPVVDLLVSFFDDVILECVLMSNRRKEIEEALLDLCKEVIAEPTVNSIRDRKNEHIVSTFIDGLILSEVPLGIRATGMAGALLHPTNPLRLGLSLFKIFAAKYPDATNQQVLEYLELEEAVRISLISEENEATADKLAKLFESPVNNSEQYMLMSLYSYTNGLVDDAIRAIELGLAAYPDNERLLQARENLA